MEAAGWAGVCRDASGALVTGFAYSVDAGSALSIETVAIRGALLFLKDHPLLLQNPDARVELEPDCTGAAAGGIEISWALLPVVR